MTDKRFCVVVYDDESINGFAVLDLQKPNSRLRLGYENVYIGSKEGCEIVCRFGNSFADENEQLKQDICNYIQRRLNECQNGGVKRFVNEAFVLEEGSGYISALLDIKKGLMKRGLWNISVDEKYGKINTEGWLK